MGVVAIDGRKRRPVRDVEWNRDYNAGLIRLAVLYLISQSRITEGLTFMVIFIGDPKLALDRPLYDFTDAPLRCPVIRVSMGVSSTMQIL